MAGTVVGTASGLLLVTAVLLLIQPHVWDFGPRIGNWSSFYLLQIILFALMGTGLAGVYL